MLQNRVICVSCIPINWRRTRGNRSKHLHLHSMQWNLGVVPCLQIEWKTWVMAAKARFWMCALKLSEALQLWNTVMTVVQSNWISNSVPSQVQSCGAKQQLRNKCGVVSAEHTNRHYRTATLHEIVVCRHWIM
jgi:hypothetical protein